MILFARLSLCLALLALAQAAVCQEVALQYNGSGSYSYIERTNLRRYDNGKYVGLVNREVRSFIARTSVPAGGDPTDSYYDGSFFVDETTLRNYEQVRDSVSGAIPSSFKISQSGELTMLTDFGYPSFRSFPAFPTQKIKIGDKWQAKAERVVDPLNKGVITKMPILVAYTYLTDEVFEGEEVYVFGAQWATRYGLSYWDFSGDKELKSAQGSHKATMYVSKRTGNALVVRDQVDETFVYKDGGSYAFKGTISMFTEYPPAYDKRKLIRALQRVAGLSAEELERVLQKPAGDAGGGTVGTTTGTASGKGSAKGTGGSAADKGAASSSAKGAIGVSSASDMGKGAGGQVADGSAGSSASSGTDTLGGASPAKNTAAAKAGSTGTGGSKEGGAVSQAAIARTGASPSQSGTSGESNAGGASSASDSSGGKDSGASTSADSAGSSEGSSAGDRSRADGSRGASNSGGTSGADNANLALASNPSSNAADSSKSKQGSKEAKSASSKTTSKHSKVSKADIEQKIASAQSTSTTSNAQSSATEGSDASEKKVTVENTEVGIRLTMQNLNFKPDSAELLPGEAERLDQIAAVLKEVPEQMFLVEGHTASVGKVAGEKQLSIERANAIAEALVERGIPRERFICKGSGGTKPVADNSTSQGRAKNRRVEITILE